MSSDPQKALARAEAAIAETVEGFLSRYRDMEQESPGAARDLAGIGLDTLNDQAQAMRAEWHRVTGDNDLPREVRELINRYRALLKEAVTHAESLHLMEQRTGKSWIGGYEGPRKGAEEKAKQDKQKRNQDRLYIERRFAEITAANPRKSGNQVDKEIAAELGCKHGRVYKIRTGRA